MDHLPYPQNPAFPRIEIPYICAGLEDYDGLDFMNYPVRRGWAQAAHSAQWMDCPDKTAAERAQNWLYFGLLLEMIGPFYRKDLFLRQKLNNGGCVIDTSKLPVVLQDWYRSVRGNRFNIFRRNMSAEVYERYCAILSEANLQSELLDRKSSECRIITLGIKVLLESLDTAVSSFVHKSIKSIEQMLSVKSGRLLYFEMVRRGWCTSQTLYLMQYEGTTVNYLAALPRRFVGLNHKDCGFGACIANNVDEKTYQTAHTKERCGCEFKGPNEAKMLQLIKEGSIPVISLAIMSGGAPRIDVVRAEPGVKYTAISHVWSGGLGNPVENSLPTCQLLKIYRLLAEMERQKLQNRNAAFQLLWQRFSTLGKKFRWHNLVFGQQTSYLPTSIEFSEHSETTPIIFWIDTLCVPVGKRNKTFRVQAIRSMDSIYAGAEHTLVLDSELEQIPQTVSEQMSAYVLCSSWMTRCWTLQEARLSQTYYVQFADGLFDGRNAEKSLDRDMNRPARIYSLKDSMHVQLRTDLTLWYWTMVPMRDLLYEVAANTEGRFINEWNNLVQRSTSRKEDIHNIFASMLGLNGGDILTLPFDQRMKAILRAQTSLPLDILFLSCPKMEELSCRWIPLYPGLGFSLTRRHGEMKISTEGVRFDKSTANFMGFVVTSSKPQLDHFGLRENSDSDPLWVTVKSDSTNSVLRNPTSIATCYILGKFADSNMRPPWFNQSTNTREDGALFAVQRREGRVLHLSYECPLEYGFSLPVFSENPKVVGQSEVPILDAELLDADQRFQIDCGESSLLLHLAVIPFLFTKDKKLN